MKRVLIVTAALVTMLTSSALAQSARHDMRSPYSDIRASAASPGNGAAAFAYDPNVVISGDPGVVSSGNRILGYDPDPNIRLGLARDASVSDY